MKTLILSVSMAFVIAGCASTYKGPKISHLVDMCLAEKNDMYLAGDCVEEKISKYAPEWRSDSRSYEITNYTDFIRAKGLQVKDGYVSEADAYRDVITYANKKADQVQAEREKRIQSGSESSAALIQAGALLIMGGRQPAYAPPAYVAPYPSDTTINIQQGYPYRFYDSRPYR